MGYNGYLVRVGAYTIPLGMIKANSYKITKNSQDLDSYRDANGVLHRNALDRKPDKIEFEIPAGWDDEKKCIFMEHIRNQYVDVKERKVIASYYDVETGEYEESEMYIPDITWTIKSVINGKIMYDSARFALIGY